MARAILAKSGVGVDVERRERFDDGHADDVRRLGARGARWRMNIEFGIAHRSIGSAAGRCTPIDSPCVFADRGHED